MENPRNKLSERISDLCAERKWSPSGLCRRAGIGKGTVAGIAADQSRTPRPSTIAKIAIALDVAPEYLMGETDVRVGPVSISDKRPGGLSSEIQRIIMSLVALNSDYASLITLDKPIPALGLLAQALVVVTRGHDVRSGDLLMVVKDRKQRVCYSAGPLLVDLSMDGTTNHFVNDDSVDVLGHIEFAGIANLGNF